MSPNSTHISARWLIAVIVCLVGAAFTAGWFLSPAYDRMRDASRSTAGESAGSSTLGVDASAPWGKLQCTRLLISPPLEFVQEMTRNAPPRKWIFRGVNAMTMDQILRDAGLSDEQRNALWDVSEPRGAKNFAFTSSGGQPPGPGDEIAFAPADDLVKGLSAECRRKLYTRLAQDDRNVDQVNVYRYLGASVEDWLAPAELSPEIVALVKSLSYQNGPYWMFADLQILLPRLNDMGERGRLLKCLASRQTWLVKLSLDKDSDLDALARYWGRGGRAITLRPYLESLSRVPGGETISIRGVLPPFVQTHLYSYPMPSQNAVGRNRDCHWTAMNFFNEKLDDRYAENLDMVAQDIRTSYHRIFANFQMGDLVVFSSKTDPMEEGRIFHSAVYIAEDLIFTKNGRQPSDPWMFMRLEEMKAFYPQTGNVEMLFFRRNDMED